MFIIILLLMVFVFVTINIFNNCIKLKNKVRQSKTTIDIYLTQRFDLIPNLVSCVNAYKEYEKSVLLELTKLREIYNENKKISDANELTEKMNDLMIRAEEMTDLKSSEQFLSLQRSLIKIESQLQAARRIYNGDATLFNTAIQTFPNNFFAKLFHFTEEELFTADEYKAQNVEVKL